MNQRPPQPQDMMSLSDALAAGTLKALDRSRIRAQLACASEESPAEMRAALMAVLSRAKDYFGVIEYTGPGYVFGRVDSEYPYALSKSFVFALYAGWQRQSLQADAQANLGELYRTASAMCLNTACRVAAYEIAQVVPESKEVLLQAARVLSRSVHRRELSGTNWMDARRRLRNKGLGKVLEHLTKALERARIGVIDRYNTVIVPASDSMHLWNDVRAWHEPLCQ